MITLQDQLDQAVLKYSGIFSEYELKNGDYLLVHFCANSDNTGIEFSFDSDNLPTYFSGEVVMVNDNRYYLEFEPEYFDNIDHYFQAIADEINEGYLLPNDLM